MATDKTPPAAYNLLVTSHWVSVLLVIIRRHRSKENPRLSFRQLEYRRTNFESNNYNLWNHRCSWRHFLRLLGLVPLEFLPGYSRLGGSNGDRIQVLMAPQYFGSWVRSRSYWYWWDTATIGTVRIQSHRRPGMILCCITSQHEMLANNCVNRSGDSRGRDSGTHLGRQGAISPRRRTGAQGHFAV